jgi:hypothetical protein
VYLSPERPELPELPLEPLVPADPEPPSFPVNITDIVSPNTKGCLLKKSSLIQKRFRAPAPNKSFKLII